MSDANLTRANIGDVDLSVAAEEHWGLVRLQVFHRTEGAVEAAAKNLDLLSLPLPGYAMFTSYGYCISTSPGQWTFLAEADSDKSLAQTLLTRLAGMLAMVTLVSDSHVALRLGGDGLREILARGTTVDLDSSRFTEGMCVSTRFAGVGVQLIREPETRGVLMLADRSHEDYLRRWMTSASCFI